MHFANIKENDIANGPGVRLSLFVSGCEHYCENCFNKEAWDFKYGNLYTQEVEENIIKSLKRETISGITILGGEPMHPKNVQTVLNLCLKIKTEVPEKKIWIFSGFTYEQLKSRKMDTTTSLILTTIDVLVDGKFVQDLYDPRLLFRGSSNQRIIDIQNTNEKGSMILCDLDHIDNY